MGRQIRTILAALAAAWLAGCATRDTSNLDIEDRSIVIPTIRIAADIGGRAVEERSSLHTSHAVEFSVAGAKGGDTQHLAAGQRPIVFGGETYNGGQDLRSEFDFRTLELGYRYRHFFERVGLGVEGLAGLGFAQLGLTVTGATQRSADRLRSGGFVLGLGGLWRITPGLSLHARATGFFLGGTEDVTQTGHYELALVQKLGGNAAVRAGYAAWDVRSERETYYSGSPNSPIRLRFSGPSLGLELMF